VVNEAEQGRAASVLPGQAEEVQAGNPGDAALVGHFAVVGHAWYVDPGVVGAVAGRPDDHADVQVSAVGELDGALVRAVHGGPEPDSGRLKPSAAAADDELPARHPPPRPGLGGRQSAGRHCSCQPADTSISGEPTERC